MRCTNKTCLHLNSLQPFKELRAHRPAHRDGFFGYNYMGASHFVYSGKIDNIGAVYSEEVFLGKFLINILEGHHQEIFPALRKYAAIIAVCLNIENILDVYFQHPFVMAHKNSVIQNKVGIVSGGGRWPIAVF